MARDYIPKGSMGWRESAGKLEWPAVRADTGASVVVTSKRVRPDGTITVEDADTGETYRTGPPLKLGQVEPFGS